VTRAWRRGDICWCELEKSRPVVILTREALIPHLNNLTVAPLTTRVRGVASQVILETFDGVLERCAISLDNIQTVPKDSLGNLITTLTRTRVRQIQRAAIFALELDLFDDDLESRDRF
jgi:mRNA interferase MazF